MGGGHHDHPPKIVIPDWRIYKVEDIPRLVRVQNILATKGLKDPWLRYVTSNTVKWATKLGIIIIIMRLYKSHS